MTEDHKGRILEAAARVYGHLGWRGATTKRIAEEAGVNEVTLFRHFGSKDALLEQMMQGHVARGQEIMLPAAVAHPEEELLAWMRSHYARTVEHRAMVRHLISDAEERPEVAACVSSGPCMAAAGLRAYADQLRRYGLLATTPALTPAELNAACAMLMGAMFADAMNRDMMSEMFPQPVDESLRSYVRIFLRAIGAPLETPHAAPTLVERALLLTPTSA